jgi:hypothetical protein
MLPWYSINSTSGGIHNNIENIRFSTVKDKLVRIELFSLNELIKIYPNFKKYGEYIIFGEDLFFNYKNYLLFENDTNFGGHGKIVTFKNITEYDLIRGDTFKLCTFLKYPFEDIYIQSGLYIYNWMVKKISIYPMITFQNRRVDTQRPRLRSEIDCLIEYKLKTNVDKSFYPLMLKYRTEPVQETQEGFILNW